MTQPRRIKVKGLATPDNVLVIGSVAYDSIITPHATGERILGGSAAYACLAASYFAPPRIVGVVGHDFRDRDRKKLAKRGIDLSGLQLDETGRTFAWRGRYHENYNRRDTEDLQLNVFERFQPRLTELQQAMPYVMLGNIRPDLQLAVLNQLTAPKFVLVDTIDIWIETQREKLGEVMRRSDLLVVNDSVAAKLTGETNVIVAGLFTLPAFPVTELRDPTGAGDSFAGALLGYLAAAGTTDFAAIRQAMVYGTAVASLTVEAFSTDRLAKSGCTEIKNRRKELLKMTKA